MRSSIRLLLTVLTITLAAPASAQAAFSFARTDIPLSAGPTSLAVADLDGKNGPDIVATLYAQSKIAVLLNNGDGTFAAPSYIAACTGAYGTKLGDVTTSGADLTQDGKLDVVTTCASRKVARMAGDGAGGFGAPVETPNAMTPGTLLLYNDPIELANIRLGGGPPLLLVQADAPNFKKVLCASYDWATLECLSPPNYPTTGGAMTSGRLNGTARDQIIVGGGSKGTVAFGIADNLPNGPGSVWSATERDSGLPNPSYGQGFRRVTDVNGDGQLDIIASVGDSFSGSFGVQLWGTGGIPDVPAVVHTSAAGLGPVVVGDFSGDGHPDVLGVTGYGRVLAHGGDGAGGFDAGTDVPLIGFQNPAYASTVTAELIDADCDGRPDAVIADNVAASVELLRNTQSPGTTRCTGTPAAGPPPSTTPVTPAPKPVVLPLTGLRGLPQSLTPGASAIIALGTASNPPTATVDLALAVVPVSAARAAATKKPKATMLGTAHIVIPAGKTRKLTLKLNARARALLQRANVKARLTIVATATDGTRATTTRKLTLKRRAVKRRRR